MQALSSVTPSLGPPGCLMQAMRALGSSLTTSSQPLPLQFPHSLFLLGSYSGAQRAVLLPASVFQDDSQLPSRQTSWPAGNVMHWLSPLHTLSHPHPQGSSSHSHLCGTSPNSRRFTPLSQELLGFHSNLIPAGPLSNGLQGGQREGIHFSRGRARSIPRSSLYEILSSLPDTHLGYRVENIIVVTHIWPPLTKSCNG